MAMTNRVTGEQYAEIMRMVKKGLSFPQIAAAMGRSRDGVVLIVNRGVTPASASRLWRLEGDHGPLSLAEREEIRVGLERGESFRSIAGRIRRAPSTVSREVARNGERCRYRAAVAHGRAFCGSRRPKATKLAERPALAAQVEAWLGLLWSPQKIARRLRIDFPGDPMMQVSHETIYQSLFVQGRGELRRELARCLRTGRTLRRPKHRVEKRGRLPGMVMVSDRPAEAEDRAVPGHWEGDLILGEGNRSAVGTLVERTSRFLMLLNLHGERSAEAVDAAMRQTISTLPKELWRSITWDQGTEMANHASFTVATNIPIYFCNPHAPWQRGSNENTNGLLRQYLPKGTDLSQLTAADLRRIQRSLNARPRKTLGYMTPSERFAQLVAATA